MLPQEWNVLDSGEDLPKGNVDASSKDISHRFAELADRYSYNIGRDHCVLMQSQVTMKQLDIPIRRYQPPRRESDGKMYVRYQVIGANTVAVPTHFYKVVVGEAADGALDMEAYVMPNQKIPDKTPVSAFMVPPETIERAAGLLFFDKVHRSKLNRINGKKV